MEFLKKTFRSKWSLFIYLFIYLFINTTTDYIWNITDFYLDETRMGASQSIGTYELGFWILAIFIVFPIQLFLTLLANIKYPGQVSLICWNKKRPYWSMFWSLVFTALIIYPAGVSIDSLVRGNLLFHPELIISLVVSLHYFFYLRASLVMSNLFYKEKHI